MKDRRPDFRVMFDDRCVLVTGGTSGIGSAVARAFKASGARVIACAADPDELAGARANPAFQGIEIRSMDVTCPQQVQAALADLPLLDAVVCAAGITLREREHEDAGFRQVMSVNLEGAMNVMRASRSRLEAARGSAVLMASMTSFRGSARMPAYAASKAAVRSLTQSLAAVHAPGGVRVNAVAPGWITTPLSKPGHDDPQWRAAVEARTPMGRWGRPEEVADPVLFLCSDAARFITGAVITVDGGFSAVV